MANLFPFPYADSTKTANGITYTVNSDKSINVSGTATADSQFYVVEASDPIELGPGYYTLQGTGDSDIQIALISVYTPGGSILYIPAGENDANFTLTETKEFHAQIGVPSGTTANLTVTPSLVKTGDLVTIDAENAKQIRKSMDVRIQVTPAQGDPIVITNENLISCVVSLRSDLSILEPTLPESEINIEAYFDTDISDTLASIPDETPVTYQAGYPGDMSPVRHFYLAEQITWADNVMSIHAVDAVHKLDEELPTAIMVMPEPNTVNMTGRSTLTGLYHALCYVIGSAGIVFGSVASGDFDRYTTNYGSCDRLVINKTSRRTVLAEMMNILHTNMAQPELAVISAFWPTYVDAGIPSFTIDKPVAKWSINEEDCGDVKRNAERKLKGARVTWNHFAEDTYQYRKIGNATMAKDSGIFLSFDSEYTTRFYIAGNLSITSAGTSWVSVRPTYDGVANSNSGLMGICKYGDETVDTYACHMIGPDVQKGIIKGPPGFNPDVNGYELYTQVVAWNSNTTQNWNEITGSSAADSYDVDLYGRALGTVEKTYLYGTADVVGDFQSEAFAGWLHSRPVAGSGSSVISEVLPQVGFESLLSRSNITGQFTWKGDPRMQPRDVVTFHRLDGTTEDITLENITITHEKGGTSAEITYRKGIC